MISCPAAERNELTGRPCALPHGASLGPAQAGAGQLRSPAPVTCAARQVDWRPAGGPVRYRVWFNHGKPDLVTSETTATAPGSGPVSVRVEAFVGARAVEAMTTSKICS